MEPLTLILTALVAGVAAGIQSTSGSAIKDAYEGLKALIKHKFAGNAAAELTLDQHEKDPQTWEKPLKKALADVQAEKDPTVLLEAQKLLSLIKSTSQAAGVTVAVSGERAVGIGGNMSDSIIISGDSNTVQRGEHNVNLKYTGSDADEKHPGKTNTGQ